MADYTMDDIAEKMRDIDYAMLSTRSDGGAIAARPMSNNRDVRYNGDSFFFTYEKTRTVEDIGRDAKVGLGFQGKGGLFGKPPVFISVEGNATLIRDKAAFKEHWTSDLDVWFKDGIDTPGIVLIKVSATRLHYWDGTDEAEIPVRA